MDYYKRRPMPDYGGFKGMSEFPAETPLGMAYVPFQTWGDIYPLEKAFDKGTIFPPLDFPFMGYKKEADYD